MKLTIRHAAALTFALSTFAAVPARAEGLAEYWLGQGRAPVAAPVHGQVGHVDKRIARTGKLAMRRERRLARASRASKYVARFDDHVERVGEKLAPPMQLSGARFAMASWYGGGEKLSRHAASGEVFRSGGLTAAHRTLPLGTTLLVSYGGRSVRVRVNDRGPAAWTGRTLDLSRGAAQALGFVDRGVVRVAWRVVG